MASVSEEDLEQIRQQNADLREKLEEERQKASAATFDASLDFQATELKAENVRLEAQLEAAKKQTEAAASAADNGGTQSPLAQVTAQLKAAQDAPPTPPGVAVEPNPTRSSDEDDSNDHGSE